MGARGPKPTPTAVKHARGTFRPDRAPKNEAQPSGKPTMAPEVRDDKDAAKAFRRIVKELDAMGLVGAADANLLSRYCLTWARWRRAMQVLAKSGEVVVYRDAEGKVKHI